MTKVPFLPLRAATYLPLIFLTLSLGGCNKAESKAEAQEMPAVSVQTVDVRAEDSPVILRLTGTLRGEQETDLAANVSGRVQKTQVERGQTVERGQLLAQVDIQSARLALAEAKVSVQTSQTQLEINKTECERYEKLKQAGVVTDQEYQQVTARCRTAPLNLEAARARESIAAKNVGDGLIRAPFAGVVTERYVEVGEYVQPSSRVVSLAQVDTLRVIFSAPEKHFPKIKMGAEVRVHVGAYDEQSFLGTVTHISGAVRATRDIVIEASVPNPDGKLLPGMFAQVELTIDHEALPVVPATAVFRQNGQDNVLLVEDGHLVQRVVSTREKLGDRIVIGRGLSAGDQVVATPAGNLKNGARVK
jgi:RND family efflux transporter MFP subunit